MSKSRSLYDTPYLPLPTTKLTYAPNLELAKLQGFRAQSSPRLPSLLTPITSLGFPEPLSDSMICYKDSQNSLKVLILTGIVYYMAGLKVKISQRAEWEGSKHKAFLVLRMHPPPGICV